MSANIMIEVSADGAAINMRKRNGVAAKLKSVKHVITVHCIANRLELGVSRAIKDHPRLKQLNDVLIFLYEQYHYCPKVLRELTMLPKFLLFYRYSQSIC